MRTTWKVKDHAVVIMTFRTGSSLMGRAGDVGLVPSRPDITPLRAFLWLLNTLEYSYVFIDIVALAVFPVYLSLVAALCKLVRH